MATVQRYTTLISVSCFIGILLSVYALYVEMKAEEDNNYEALCDISEHISCTKVFLSGYGRGFGIIGQIFGENSPLNLPNGFYGIGFYLIMSLLNQSRSLSISRLLVILNIISNLLSLYLAYLLYFVLEDFCVVCVSIYGVSFVNLILSLKRHSAVINEQKARKSLKKSK
uniref:vitamin-K-epoxide reductase (warfarin-sensitive) n=1 Tax=Corethrella appendiculata TaxID=1370023 RepID=U5EPS2_9DIPT